MKRFAMILLVLGLVSCRLPVPGGEGDAALLLTLFRDASFFTYLGGSSADMGRVVAQSADGSFFLAGTSLSTSLGSTLTPVTTQAGGNDLFLARYTSLGAVKWYTFFGSAGNEGNPSIAVSVDGGIILAGACRGSIGPSVHGFSGTSGSDICVTKFDSSGSRLWTTLQGGGGAVTCSAFQAVESTAGDIYVAGSCDGALVGGVGSAVNAFSGGVPSDGILLKFGSNGVLQWHTYIGSAAGADTLRSLLLNADGTILTAGTAAAAFGIPVRAYTSGTDILVAKFTASGSYDSHTFIGGSGTEALSSHSMAFLPDGGVVLAGSSDAVLVQTPLNAYSGGGTDVFLARISPSNLALQWHTYAGGSGNELVAGLSVSGSDIFVSGASNTTFGSPIYAYNGSGLNSGMLLRFSLQGIMKSNSFFGGTAAATCGTVSGTSNYGFPGGPVMTCTFAESLTIGGQSPLQAYSAGQDAAIIKLNSSGML